MIMKTYNEMKKETDFTPLINFLCGMITPEKLSKILREIHNNYAMYIVKSYINGECDYTNDMPDELLHLKMLAEILDECKEVIQETA